MWHPFFHVCSVTHVCVLWHTCVLLTHVCVLWRMFQTRKDRFMTRRELREQIFKVLFGAEFHDRQEMPGQIAVYEETEQVWDSKDGAYITEKCENIIAHLPEIDAAVNEVSEGWKTGRMGKVDLTLIRLAVYEMKYDEEVPVGVAINEAVELAKKYGTDDSPSFINGVLAKLA